MARRRLKPGQRHRTIDAIDQRFQPADELTLFDDVTEPAGFLRPGGILPAAVGAGVDAQCSRDPLADLLLLLCSVCRGIPLG